MPIYSQLLSAVALIALVASPALAGNLVGKNKFLNVLMSKATEQTKKTSCMDQGECKDYAKKLGLKVGGNGWSFAGAYHDKGCYTWRGTGVAYWGTGGSSVANAADVAFPKERVVCTDHDFLSTATWTKGIASTTRKNMD